jgi:GNAT superfamily N-acetyltransferase
MTFNVEYLPDAAIDKALDAELRGLLTLCFTKAEDVVFRTRRYFKEPYAHRWVIRDGNGALIAHAGVHDKQIEAAGRLYRIGGLCEVCVRPSYRGRGFVRAMLAAVDDWMRRNAFDFAVLFGDAQVYKSSGYVAATVLIDEPSPEGGGPCPKPSQAMVKPVGVTPWPDGDVRLIGIKF